MAAKVDRIVQLAQHAVQVDEMCVVIGLQSTGEAATNKRPCRGQLVSVAKSIMTNICNKIKSGAEYGVENDRELAQIRDELLAEIEALPL
jgi:hypothetical protein